MLSALLIVNLENFCCHCKASQERSKYIYKVSRIRGCIVWLTPKNKHSTLSLCLDNELWKFIIIISKLGVEKTVG